MKSQRVHDGAKTVSPCCWTCYSLRPRHQPRRIWKRPSPRLHLQHGASPVKSASVRLYTRSNSNRTGPAAASNGSRAAMLRSRLPALVQPDLAGLTRVKQQKCIWSDIASVSELCGNSSFSHGKSAALCKRRARDHSHSTKGQGDTFAIGGLR